MWRDADGVVHGCPNYGPGPFVNHHPFFSGPQHGKKKQNNNTPPPRPTYKLHLTWAARLAKKGEGGQSEVVIKIVVK